MNSLLTVFLFVLSCVTFQSPASAILSKEDKNRSQRSPNNRDVSVKHPWQVQVLYYQEPDCGGSIVNKKWVLTAASCAQVSNLKDLLVHAGEKETGNLYSVEMVKIHENYDKDSHRNDIALIKVSPEFEFGYYIRPVPLAEPGKEIESETPVTVPKTDDMQKSEENTVQQDVAMLTMTTEECNKVLSENNVTYKVDDSQLCLKSTNGSEKICEYDRGNPVITDDEQQVGVVSYIINCKDGTPIISSKVSHYTNWVKNNTQK